ncbi:AfsR/SARP family transcriptional regulator [Microbispora sp. H10670]|uniref:AfsR/SARP family transcriptional regulator n=1 Tax=Microbispora sp. H10670 TaxID=2729108 RepID=UPI0016040232|nr:AfsR/SARP family transcriptional regulator [Microbispora sp. H10670]
MIAALLMQPNRPVTVESLTRAIWQKTPRSIRSNLRTYVSQLRRNFAAARIPPARLITETCGYRLAVLPQELDLWRFEQLVEDGERALTEGDPVRSLNSFERALELWRGQPLAGLQIGPLLEIETLRLQERKMVLWQRWADAALAAGRHEAVAVELACLVRSEPLREQLWAQFMLALFRSGRQAEALHAYRELFDLLDKELGVEPCQRVQSLHLMMLTGDRVLAVAEFDWAHLDGRSPAGSSA